MLHDINGTDEDIIPAMLNINDSEKIITRGLAQNRRAILFSICSVSEVQSLAYLHTTHDI